MAAVVGTACVDTIAADVEGYVGAVESRGDHSEKSVPI